MKHLSALGILLGQPLQSTLAQLSHEFPSAELLPDSYPNACELRVVLDPRVHRIMLLTNSEGQVYYLEAWKPYRPGEEEQLMSDSSLVYIPDDYGAQLWLQQSPEGVVKHRIHPEGYLSSTFLDLASCPPDKRNTSF